MNSSDIFLLATSLLVFVSVFALIMLRRYSQRLTRIDEELREITTMLSQMPKENSIRDYMFAQDQRLVEIRKKLESYPGTDVLQQYIQDQANQIIAIISTQEESRSSVVTRADLEVSLQLTNELLEKVLWSLRFDVDKYDEDTDTSRDSPEKQPQKNINTATKHAKVGKAMDDQISMKSILEENSDSYGAMLKYMQLSGKSGTEALQALEAARVMRNR